MSSGPVSDRETVMGVYAELEAAFEKVAALSYEALTDSALVAVLARYEQLRRRLPVVDHAVITRLVADADPAALGASSLGCAIPTTRLPASTGNPRPSMLTPIRGLPGSATTTR